MLCREPRLYSCQRLKQAADVLGIELDILDPNRCLVLLERGESRCYYQSDMHSRIYELANYAGVLGRFGTSSTASGCRVLSHFEQQGIPILNNAVAFALARDKWLSLQQLNYANIPIPTSLISGNLVNSGVKTDFFDFPVVIKTLTGSQGVGVMLGESASSTKAILDVLNDAKIQNLTQHFVAEAQGKDIRAFVIGEEVIASMTRKNPKGEFRANIHQGGIAQEIQLTEEERLLAVKATKTIGLDVAGVDLIRSSQGTMVLEVNASPGLEMIEKVSGVDIAGKMISYLLKKIDVKA